MTFKELREQSGMSRPQFAEYFGIPYRTVQDWELENRKCNDYILNLLEYKLKHEGLIRADMDKEVHTSSVMKSVYDERKKCVDNSNYIGNKKHPELL